VYGAEKELAKWWKEVGAEEEKRAKKGQKINRFDGLYHSKDDEDDEDPKSKREFADGGVVSGANFYADKNPHSKRSKRHHESTDGVADIDREILKSSSHKKQHKHHHQAQHAGAAPESFRTHADPSYHDPELISSLNKKVKELKNKG